MSQQEVIAPAQAYAFTNAHDTAARYKSAVSNGRKPIAFVVDGDMTATTRGESNG